MLKIENLEIQIEDVVLIKELNLDVSENEIHVIMGPNGMGKSTLAKTLAGHPSYKSKGNVTFKNENLLELDIEKRANLGLFVGFQYPIEIPGVNNFQFLFQAVNAKRKFDNLSRLNQKDFEKLLSEKMKILNINPDFIKRCLNDGFSGGEKKKFEILQMLLLDVDLAILDEIDSGLDIDAVKIVAEAINLFKKDNKSIILITHYKRILDFLDVDYVHILKDKKIVKSGSSELANILEEKGYDGIE